MRIMYSMALSKKIIDGLDTQKTYTLVQITATKGYITSEKTATTDLGKFVKKTFENDPIVTRESTGAYGDDGEKVDNYYIYLEFENKTLKYSLTQTNNYPNNIIGDTDNITDMVTYGVNTTDKIMETPQPAKGGKRRTKKASKRSTKKRVQKRVRRTRR